MSGQPQVRPDPALRLLEIYDTALPQVHGYLLSRCRNRTLAQDLAAETFLAAVTAARRQPTPPITTGWLVGVARHKLIDHWRRAEREQRGLRLVHAAGGETDDPWDVQIDTMVAYQVLDALGPHHRAALTLRYLERAAADYDYGRNAVVIDPSGHRWMISTAPAATPTPRHGDLAYLTHAVADTERARTFYGAVLGWTFRPGRVEDGWHIEGTYPPAGMHGGAGQPGLEPVYQVDDLAAALAAVRDHGGQAGEPQQQPYGRIAECVDDQGAPFQLLQS